MDTKLAKKNKSCNKIDGEGTSAGCNMKTNGIVAAQHPKSTRKKKTNKKATTRLQEKGEK